MTWLELAQPSKVQPPILLQPARKEIHISLHVGTVWCFRSYLRNKYGEVYIPHTRKGVMCLYLVRGKRNLVD